MYTAVLWPQIICIDMDHAYFGPQCPNNNVRIHEKQNKGAKAVAGFVAVERRR